MAFIKFVKGLFATYLVAMERALGFGARWRFHIEMRNGYKSILDMINLYPTLPFSERPKYLKDIWNTLYALRNRESSVAKTSSSPQ